MSELELTTEQMDKRVARFRDLRPYKDTMNDAHGIPPEAMRMMSPDKVYPKDTVVHAREVGDELARRFGQETRDAMAGIGVRFGE